MDIGTKNLGDGGRAGGREIVFLNSNACAQQLYLEETIIS